MADKTVSDLTSATTLDGTEIFYAIQSANSRKVAGSEIVKISHNQAWSTITSTPTTLSGYGITDAQPLDSDLTAIAALDKTDGNFIVANGTAWTVESGATARTSLGLGTAATTAATDYATAAQGTTADSALQPGDIGTTVQAQGATLDSLEGLTLASGDVLYATAADTLTNLAKGTEGQVLKVSATGIPEWGTVAGTGDMLAATYDPNAVSGDAFDMANMVEATDAKIMTAAERTKLTGIEASADVTDATNVDAAGATMNTDTDVSGNSWVLDEDDMASDSATKVPTQQSVKAKIDNDTILKVADRTALKAVDTATHGVVYFDGSNWEQVAYSDVSALVAADTVEGIYARSTQDTTKVWARQFDGEVNAKWFGMVGDSGTTDNIDALTAIKETVGDRTIFFPVDDDGGQYYVTSGSLTLPNTMALRFERGAVLGATGDGILTKNAPELRFGGGTSGAGTARLTRGLSIEMQGANTGSVTTVGASLNMLNIPSDTVDGTTGGGSKVDGLSLFHTFGGTGAKGGRHAFQVRLSQSALMDADNPDQNYVGIAIPVTTSVGDHGTDTEAKGTYYGLNPHVIAEAGALYLKNLTGGEFDVGIETGASAEYRGGIELSSHGAEQAYLHDCAVAVVGKIGSPGWKAAIKVGRMHGGVPLSSDGTVLDATSEPALQHGIDFDGVVFSGSILRASAVNITNTGMSFSSASSSLSLGKIGASNSPHIDFQSSSVGAAIYDSRILGSGGSGANGAGTLTFDAGTNAFDGIVRPVTDNNRTLGAASQRWSEIFAGTGTINTSDEREKEEVEDIPDAVLDAWQEVKWCQFRFNDGSRKHTGLVAQRVVQAFERNGLDATEYGLLCYDEWDAKDAVLDEEGAVIEPAIEAGSRYGVRYEEALALEAALVRRALNRLTSSG